MTCCKKTCSVNTVPPKSPMSLLMYLKTKSVIGHIPHDVCARLRIGHFKHACVVRQHQNRRYFRHRVVHATQPLHSLAHCGRTMVPHTDVQVFTITTTARQTLQCLKTHMFSKNGMHVQKRAHPSHMLRPYNSAGMQAWNPTYVARTLTPG